jgi:hypothetical protein
MKKAEHQKTTYSTVATTSSYNAAASNTATKQVTHCYRADPSSVQHSNRYPIPTLGYRTQAAE